MNQIEILPPGKKGRPGKPRVVFTSHSIDDTFDYCPRKFEFLNIHDQRPPRDSGYAADVGTALHEGTQAWLIARAEGKSQAEAEVDGFMALLKWFPWMMELEQKTQVRSNWNVIMMLQEIMRNPEWDGWELIKIDGKWAVEVPFTIYHTSLGEFEVKHTGETIILATQGKIDFILRHKRSGKIKTRDLKTTSKSTDLIRSEYTFSGQQVGYSQVLHALLGIPMTDFSVDYLIAHFDQTEGPDIQVVTIKKDEEDLDDYWFTKLDRLERIKAYSLRGWFPRTNGGCNAWNHECSCFDICHTRKTSLVVKWFQDIGAVPAAGYTPWVTLEV